MRLLICLCVLCTISFINCLQAQNLWIVSNDPSYTVADFDTIQEAIDAATDGDKIYVHGSATQYPSFIVDKKLHVLGSGYWKSENTIPDPNTSPSQINSDVTLAPGSNGSIIEGFFVNDDIIIDADSVICRYNRLNEMRFENNPNTVFVYGSYMHTDGSSPLTGSATGTTVSNCIMKKNQAFPDVWGSSSSNSGCSVKHCSIQFFPSISNCSVFNNIFSTGAGLVSLNNTGVPQHNIFTADVLGLDTTNLTNVDIATVWNLSDPSPDGKYRLIGDPVTNPAFGFADDGSDVGAFGGVGTYILSGIVPIPVVHKMIVPLLGDTTNMLNVTIKAKSNE